MADYEQKQIRITSYERSETLLHMKIFGWQKIGESSYKNGDFKLVFRRDFDDQCYSVWCQNESLYTTIGELGFALYDFGEAASQLKATKASVAKRPEHQLFGIKKLFGIRSQEDKRRIDSETADINQAYNALRNQIQTDTEFIESLTNDHCKSFFEWIEANPGKIHPCREKVLSILQRYLIDTDVEGHVSCNIASIEYDFETKGIKFVKSDSKE